jgi:hypothetical protein
MRKLINEILYISLLSRILFIQVVGRHRLAGIGLVHDDDQTQKCGNSNPNSPSCHFPGALGMNNEWVAFDVVQQIRIKPHESN